MSELEAQLLELGVTVVFLRSVRPTELVPLDLAAAAAYHVVSGRGGHGSRDIEASVRRGGCSRDDFGSN